MTHYPKFDVLAEKEHWDPHTRKVVTKRLQTESFYPWKSLTEKEADTLSALCKCVLDDEREPILSYVLHHFDSLLQSTVGESQRKMGIPAQTSLLRQGLAFIEQLCTEQHESPFDRVADDAKTTVINMMLHGTFPEPYTKENSWIKAFIQKIVSETTAAYYSHPTIWSEIGYAGPAYPRGYVRTELGLTDPWEAMRDE